MKNSYRLIFLAASIAATAPAIRADEFSDIMAGVAGSMQKIQSDRRILRFDSLPAYVSKETESDIALLDGVYRAMNFQASLDFIINAYDYRGSSAFGITPSYDNRFDRPTLGRSDFFRPVPGIITSRFGWRPQFNRMHHGVDLHLNIGDTVRAAVGGIVEKIAYDHGGYGHYVVLNHADGMETIYGHLSYALVSQGQYVEMGQPLAIGGNTGNSTGPHLHFEARLGGVAVDPTLIFDFYGKYRVASRNLTIDHASAAQSSRTIPENKRTYVVRQGDTPKSVARRAGISVLRLCQLNMIKDSEPLEVGRMLKIR